MATTKKPPSSNGAAKKPSQRPTRFVVVEKLVIPHPNTLPPDAETNVSCPVCQQGMVPASVGARVKTLLREAGDGPSGSPPPPSEEGPPK